MYEVIPLNIIARCSITTGAEALEWHLKNTDGKVCTNALLRQPVHPDLHLLPSGCPFFSFLQAGGVALFA